MKIGVDLDEVLTEYVKNFIIFHNQNYGTKLNFEDIKKYFFYELLGISFEEDIGRQYKFFETDLFKQIQPVSGAVNGVDKLKNNFEMVIITARPNEIKDKSINWIEKYFPDIFSQIIFTNKHSLNNDLKREKHDICLELGVNLIIEDSLATAEKCASIGIKVLLLDKPWNQAENLPNGIKRVHSWEEIVREIESIKK